MKVTEEMPFTLRPSLWFSWGQRGCLQDWAAPPYDLFGGGGGGAPQNIVTPSTWFIWFSTHGVGGAGQTSVCLLRVCVCMCVCVDGRLAHSSADVYTDLSSTPFISRATTVYESILLLLGSLYPIMSSASTLCIIKQYNFHQHVKMGYIYGSGLISEWNEGSF